MHELLVSKQVGVYAVESKFVLNLAVSMQFYVFILFHPAAVHSTMAKVTTDYVAFEIIHGKYVQSKEFLQLHKGVELQQFWCNY